MRSLLSVALLLGLSSCYMSGADETRAIPWRPTGSLSLYKDGMELPATAYDFNRLRFQLSSDKWYVRANAASELGKLNLQAAVPHLLTALLDAHPSVRISAAISLGLLKNRKALFSLRVLLKDTDNDVRDAARQAIRMIQGKPVSDAKSSHSQHVRPRKSLFDGLYRWPGSRPASDEPYSQAPDKRSLLDLLDDPKYKE